MMYRNINTGVEKGVFEEELPIALPPVELRQSSMFYLLADSIPIQCVYARQQKRITLTFFDCNCRLLSSYLLVHQADPTGFLWGEFEQSINLNLHKTAPNPIWRVPTMPEESTWMVGVSFLERARITEPYAIALGRRFLTSAIYIKPVEAPS